MADDPRDLDLPLEGEELEAPEVEEVDEGASDEEMMAALEAEIEATSPEESDDGESGEPPVGDEETPAEPAAEAKDDDGAGEPEPEQPPEEKARPSDEFGELDKRTPEKTRERFQAIKGKYDELSEELEQRRAEVEQIRGEASEWVSAIRDTGTTPEQFGETLQFLREINSGEPKNLERAYEYLSRLQVEVGKKIGRGSEAYDPLEEFPELKQRVEDGYLERSDAEELVRARKIQQRMEQANAESQQKSQQDNELAQGMLQLKELGEQLQKDPAFKMKFPVIKGIIENLPNTGLPPSKWRDTIATAYNSIQIPVTPAAPKVRAPNPLRPSPASPANAAMQKEPGSAVEALDLALERGW